MVEHSGLPRKTQNGSVMCFGTCMHPPHFAMLVVDIVKIHGQAVAISTHYPVASWSAIVCLGHNEHPSWLEAFCVAS